MDVLLGLIKDQTVLNWVIFLTICYFVTSPDRLRSIAKIFETLKFGSLEVKFREFEEKIKQNSEMIESIESKIDYNRETFDKIVSGLDVEGSVEALRKSRVELKDLARTIGRDDSLFSHFKQLDKPEEILAAAEIVRANRDASAFDAIIDLLSKVAADPDLLGFRFYIVWCLTSAVHLITVSNFRKRAQQTQKLSKDQLERAKQVLMQLKFHPKVSLDRPDNPKRGILGPVTWALGWIEKSIDADDE